MVRIFQYDTIVKYVVTAVCREPLHIGSADGDRGQVLVHPVDGLPFVQASSICGVFQAYFRRVYGAQEADLLFGRLEDGSDDDMQESRIRISDGKFCMDDSKLKLELRPRLKIDPRTGSCDSSLVQGSNISSGHKFEMEYIGAGARMVFSIYLYDVKAQEKLEHIFTAIQQQQIQFGGQKSNGCGYLQIEKLLCREFHMQNPQERELWFREEELEEQYYRDCLPNLDKKAAAVNAYEVIITGQTEGELLVKSAVTTDYSKDAPKYVNMQNVARDYIVPGSSLKGSIRSQMEKIAAYLQAPEMIDDAFGIPDSRDEKGKSGNLYFFDTIVGKQEDNDRNRITHRIHIDKFTGGVMHGSLFSEKNVFGDMEMRIRILKKNKPDGTCGLLLLALRDMAVGMLSIGGGRNVGKGFVQVEKLVIKSEDGAQAEIMFPENKICDPSGIIDRCLRAVREEEHGISCAGH